MKAENNQMFTEVSSEEAVTINGGYYNGHYPVYPGYSSYINSFVAASGAYNYTPYAKHVIGNGQIQAYQAGGTTGQLNYLLGAASSLSRF